MTEDGPISLHKQNVNSRIANSLIATLGLLLPFVSGCESEKPTKTSSPKKTTPVIYTTFYPMTYLTQRIGGEHVKVVCPCPSDADPARWMPDNRTIEAYQQADLIVINGASFETWVDKVTLPRSRLVNTTNPLDSELIILKESVKHTHGPSGDHSHEGVDGHTWLDPINAKLQAAEIKNALTQRLPDRQAAFEQGYAALAKDLEALNARLKAISEKLRGQRVLSSHPAYNYLARRYQWQQEYFLLDPEALPDEATMRQMQESVRNSPARYMLWKSQPAEHVAETIRNELGVQNVLFSPCESLESDEKRGGMDYLSVMNANLDRLEEALVD